MSSLKSNSDLLMGLSVELHLEIVEYLDIKALIALVETHSHWINIIQKYKSIQRGHYTFLDNGVGIHNLLIQGVGEDLECELDEKTNLLKSMTYLSPSESETTEDPTTKIIIPVSSPLLDEPVIFPGSLPPTIPLLWKTYDDDIILPRPEYHDWDSIGSSSSRSPSPLQLERIPPIREFDSDRLYESFGWIDDILKPGPSDPKFPDLESEEEPRESETETKDPDDLPSRGEFTIRHMLQAIMTEELGHRMLLRSVQQKTQECVWSEEEQNFVKVPEDRVFTFAGQDRSSSIENGSSQPSEGWVFSGSLGKKRTGTLTIS
ncbi:hypothetical protein TWF106_002171 [Orbilia oligospora]|uniref:F-box domain-containing protein n=1 Tax=Orbilia oligospora TaxID=2813651 RepID=A0A7C8QT58_ORBOL|nr:hypothetical protein TWF106_002171 [Orbilia oligospora]